MTTGTRANFQSALDKAAERGGMLLIQRDRGDGRYDVQGSCGRSYVVTVLPDGEYSCTCKANAEFERCCYHMASVAMLRAAQSAAGIAPAAPRESDATVRARLLAESRERAQTIDELEDLPSLSECFNAA